jgi:iron complex outermembrane receptor protein
MKAQYLACASLFALSAGWTGQASAQTEPHSEQPPLQTAQASPVPGTAAGDREVTSVSEVVVTARRREERLVDVPIASTVLDEQLIRDQGNLTDMQDLLANTPAASFLNTTNPVNSEVNVRGSGTSRGTNAQSGVGLYRDGAYIGGGSLGGRTFTRLDLFDVQRAEVLRGPQGALYGRNAVGGAINMISEQPTFEEDLEVFLEVGNKKHYEAQIIANAPINEIVSVRLGAFVDRQDEGFFYNPTLDSYLDMRRGGGVRGQIRFRTGNFDGRFIAEYSDFRLQGVTPQLRIAPNAVFPQGVFDPAGQYPRNDPSYGLQEVESYQLVWSYDFGAFDLSSTTLLRNRDSNNIFDRDALDEATLIRLRAGGGARTTDPNTFSNNADETRAIFQDVHLSGDALAGRLDWLVGADYLRLESDTEFTIGRRPSTFVPGPSLGTVTVGTLDQTSWAVYGSLGYDLTERLNLTGELRYSKDEKTFDIDRIDIRTRALVNPARFSNGGEKESDNVAYTVSAAYKFMPDWLAYAKVGTAYRAGSFNDELSDEAAPRPAPVAYEDETSITYEAGAKGDLVRGLFVAAAGYFTKTDNLLIQLDDGCVLQSPPCFSQPVGYIDNIGQAEILGLELEANYRTDFLGGRLRLNGGVTRQEGEIVSGPDVGREIPRIPDWIAKVNINWERAVDGDRRFFTNVRIDSEWGGIQEIEQTPELVDHTLVDVRLGFRTDRYEIALYSDNAFDEIYPVFVGPSALRYNIPRRYGVQVRYNFAGR